MPKDDARDSEGDGIPVAGGDCLYDYGAEAVAGPDGEFTVDMDVAVGFQRSDDELIDCREAGPPFLIPRTTIEDDPRSRMVVQPFQIPEEVGR